MVLMIVSGRSGSGKSVALRALEDMGFYCVDNLPVVLLPDLARSLADRNISAAVSIDVRNMPESPEIFEQAMKNLPECFSPQLLFLDADYVFDVRFLPNPHWDPKLRPMTGLDKPVAAFLDRHTEVHNFIYQTRSYLELWLPMLETNNRSYLTVAIGCTGGKHRSVYIAEQLADYFRSRGKNVQSRHRTLEKRKS